VHIVGLSELKPELLLAKIVDPERCSVNSLKMPINGLGLPCLQVLLAQRSFSVGHNLQVQITLTEVEI